LHYHRRQYDFWVPLKGRLRVGLADLRKDSGTCGKSMEVEMDAEKYQGLLIPPGVAHGFAALEEVILVYVVSNYYDGSDEHGIAWNDPALGIDWGIEDPILSKRDSENSVSAADIAF
ncbi:MAG: dTDP-4-dehydrorhamnose 3,5-epimerase, partial [Candidatus Aegiribacteria sp.]|nr:dTDP-4-dehydrorhamnose 3,5-epimerase [Candidatus Aegiribacteria sp.]